MSGSPLGSHGGSRTPRWRIGLRYLVIAAISIVLGYQASYALAFSGMFECVEMGCGILAEWVLLPALSTLIFCLFLLALPRLRS